MKKNMFVSIIVILLVISVTVNATLLYSAKDIEFNSGNSDWNVTNVEDAINSLKTTQEKKMT